MSKDLRNDERLAFLKANTVKYQKIVPLKVDASSRKYFRIFCNGRKTLVLADDVLKKNKLSEFERLSDFFLKHGVKVPKVYASDLSKGFLLLEDLGDDTFTRLLENDADEAFLYNLATDALIKVCAINDRPDFVKDLDKSRLINDICFFADWYIPMVKGRPLSIDERQEFVVLVSDLADMAFKVPNKMVLWDYHVDNIMLEKGAEECTLIDFQDAMWGPLTYDLMSLLEDARREVSFDVQLQMKQKFFNALKGIKRKDFDDSYAFLSLFRHMRVLGRFTILAYVNGKPQYLKFVPHLWNMLEKTLNYEKFSPLKNWLNRVLAPNLRKIPQKKPVTEAMILAAGRGVRMRELTDNLPKPLIKVSNKALIDYNFERVLNVGIKDIVVNLCYHGDLIKNHIQKTYPDLNVRFSIEKEALETGGGIKKALPFFKNDAFFVCNSDVFFEEENLKPAMWRMLDAWDENKFDIMLLLQDMAHICGDKGKGDYRLNNGFAERNKNKESGFDYMFAGIYIIKKSVFNKIKEDKFSSVKLFDEAEKNGRLGFVCNQSTFYHVGTPEALSAAENKLKQK